MRKSVLVALVASLLPLAAAQKHSSSAANPRGKYLVEGIGLCADCHTPRDQKGEPIKSQWLMGAPIMFKPTVSMPWADQAPQIAGLPGWTKEAAIKFLTTGIAYNGYPARPPMPQYRFNRADAEAVVAYLKALTPSSK